MNIKICQKESNLKYHKISYMYLVSALAILGP